MRKPREKLIILLIAGLCCGALLAENEYEARFAAGVRFSPLKKTKLYLVPEIRLGGGEIQKILVEAKAKYAFADFLDLGASYKPVWEPGSAPSFTHRFEIYSRAEHKLDRYTPSLRVLYANYDEDSEMSAFLRARLGTEYNIPDCRIDPYVSAELTYELNEGLYKWRYTAGADWRLDKHNVLGLNYKLDDRIDSGKFEHIFSLEYIYKF